MFNAQEQGSGFSCVHEAASTDAHQCLSLLVDYNERYFEGMIDLDQTELNGRSPLMIACLNGFVDAVSALLDAGESAVDCNKCDKSGNSVLLYAVESGSVDVVEALVRHPEQGRILDFDEILKAKKAAEMQDA